MKKKRIISRKKRALLLILLCLLLFAAYFATDPYGYGFSKETAVADRLEYFAVGEAEIFPSSAICSNTEVDGFPTLFAVNDYCMMHIMLNHSFMHGWQYWGSAVLDCSEEAPLHAGVHIVENHGTEIRTARYFGRIYDERISSLKFEIVYLEHYDETVVIQTDNIAVTEQGRFFCVDEHFTSEYPGINTVTVIAYDSSGELIYSAELKNIVHTTYN